MSFEIKKVWTEYNAQAYELHSQHLNTHFVNLVRAMNMDRTYERAQGSRLYHSDGKHTLDFLAGSGTFLLGRNHPKIKQALHDALDADLPSLVMLGALPLAPLLAAALNKRAPWLEKAFFCNSGSEAVEASIKFARRFTSRPKIIYTDRAFHGMTYGALSLNGNDVFRLGFGPYLQDCVRVPYGDAAALRATLAEGDVAAFIFEPILGNGVIEASAAYLRAAREACSEHGALLIADEVQTGGGRTGKFFAFEHAGIEPDMALLSKALSGGLVPVAATLCRREIFETVFGQGMMLPHGSTYSRNTLAMVAGLATLSVIEEEQLVERAAEVGARFRARLEAIASRYRIVREIRGKGMMLGIIVEPEPGALRIGLSLAGKHDIHTHVTGTEMDCIKLLPPINTSEEDLEAFCAAFESIVEEEDI